MAPGLALAIGYRRFGALNVRADALERLSKAAHQLTRQGPVVATESLRALVGCGDAELGGLLRALGYRAEDEAGLTSFAAPRPGMGRAAKTRDEGRFRRTRRDSPFATLAQLRFRK